MKLVFHFCKFFSFFLFVLYIFISCKSTSVISIISSDTVTGNLTMIDENEDSAGTFIASPGEKIKWKIKDKAVKAFDSMPPKITPLGDTLNIFKQEPHKKFLSKTWKAKIANTDFLNKYGATYYYNIIWLDKSKVSHTYDPVIKVNPRSSSL